MTRSSKKARKPRASPVAVFDRFSPLLDDEPQHAAPATFTVKTRVWRWKDQGGWHFANLPKAESAEIRAKHASVKRGWGSVPVRIRIGGTEWETSLFPAGKTRSYLFAIKASVRQAEGIADGSLITAQITPRQASA